MSEFFELVDRLCPEGVEWKALGEAFTRIRGTPITAMKMKEIANPAGDIRIFAGGKTVIDAFKKDTTLLLILHLRYCFLSQSQQYPPTASTQHPHHNNALVTQKTRSSWPVMKRQNWAILTLIG